VQRASATKPARPLAGILEGLAGISAPRRTLSPKAKIDVQIT